MKITYKPTDKFPCPNPECGEEQESPADDYAIAGRVGPLSASRTQCGYCDHWFSAVRLNNGKISVE